MPTVRPIGAVSIVTSDGSPVSSAEGAGGSEALGDGSDLTYDSAELEIEADWDNVRPRFWR